MMGDFSAASQRSWRSVALANVVAVGLASCTSAGSGTNGAASSANKWEVDRLAARCIGTMLVSGVAGGIIGAALGGKGRHVALGAGAGLAAGGVICAIMSVLDAQDKERIRAAQLQAAETGEPVLVSYNGTDGRLRMISVTPGPAIQPSGRPLESGIAASEAQPPIAHTGEPQSAAELAASQGGRICRNLSSNVTVQQAGSAQISQRVCRDEKGDWQPVTAVAAG